MKQRRSTTIWRVGLALLLVAMYVAAMVSVARLGVVPSQYGVMLAGGAALVVLLVLWGLLKPRLRWWARVLAAVATLGLIAGGGYVTWLSVSTQNFFDQIEPEQTRREHYSILRRTDSSATLASAQKVTLLATDPYYDQVTQALQAKTPATPQPASDLAATLPPLAAGEAQLVTLNVAHKALLAERDEQFNATYTEIAQFTIEVKSQRTKPLEVDAERPFIVYISGIDTYGDIASVSRSDVNMLAVANPTTRKLLLINTPRDYYVQLHGTTGTPDKLTHAGIYGVDMSRQTLEDLYGTSIDYYARVNFSSLERLVDTIGGIEVKSDYAFKSFQVGKNQLDGARALEFSRERYSFSEGDRQRGKNQQRVIEAIVAKLSRPSTLVHYQGLLGSLGGAIQTDAPTDLIKQLTNRQLASGQAWQVESISVDGTGAMAPTYSMGAQPLYVMQPDMRTVEQAKTRIREILAR